MISTGSETASPPEKEVEDSAAKAPHKVKESADKALKKSAASEESPSEPLVEDSVVAKEGNTVDRPVKKKKKGGNVPENVPVEAPPSASGGDAMQFVVESIRIRDVKNTGGMFDGQDPAVTITLGEQKKATKRYSPLYFKNTLNYTYICDRCRVKDAGVNADFKEKFAMDISEADLDKEVGGTLR